MRYVVSDLEQILVQERKMAFVAGPRQVGKTTLAQKMLPTSGAYFNWDIDTDRRRILRDPIHFWKPPDRPPPSRIVLDEIHKFPRWKRFLKGLFDSERDHVRILVTGSGRLDIYQRGGDSLFGRYHLYHLFPFSVGELVHLGQSPLPPDQVLHKILGTEKSAASDDALKQLWHRNGFPEPLFAADSQSLHRWQNDHRQRILREEMRDLTQIRELGLVENLIELLPERIGFPLSINALREDLGVNFKTVQNWIQVLDRLYYLFRLRPYAQKLARALHREEKVYFYDGSVLEDEGKRFENLVALHLQKACRYWTDAGHGDYRLHYVRDKEKREVDFLITERHHPFLLVEAKLSETEMDPSLRYFHRRLKPAHTFQVVFRAPTETLSEREPSLYLCSASRFLTCLP